MKSMSQQQELYNKAMESSGSLEEANNIKAESIEGKLNTLKDAGKEFWSSLINSGQIKTLIDDVTSFIEVIGSITAVKVDEVNKTVALGYCFGSKWWNKGYATETLKRVIKFFFEEVCVETIYANHLVDNIASGKVMQKAGMTFEGTLRNRMIDKITNKPMGLDTYSIIKEDYFK